MAAPALIAYADTGWTATTVSHSTSSFTWQTGDVFIAIATAENTNAVNDVAPTAGAGLTFTSQLADIKTGASNAPVSCWVGTATGNGSGTISWTYSTTAGGPEWGFAVWQYRASGGIGASVVSTAGSASLTINLTRTKAQSAVVWLTGDWNGSSPTGHGWTPAGQNERVASQSVSHYSVYAADWPDQGAPGTTTYGLTSVGTMVNSMVAVEVTGVPTPGLLPTQGGKNWRRRFRHRQTALIDQPVVLGPGGTTQPRSAIAIPRRYPSRAVWSPTLQGTNVTAGVNPRCVSSAATAGTGTTSFNVPLTGWTNSGIPAAPGTAPVPGDFVALIGSVFGASATITQTGGTGTWTIVSNNNGGTTGLTSFIAYRVWDGTETAPTFSWSGTLRNSYSVIALAPDPGFACFLDTSATVQIDTAVTTTHTANPATVTAGYTDCSLILASACANATGANPFRYFAPDGWTVPANGSISSVGSAAQTVCGDSIAYLTARTGTVTPSSETIEGGPSLTGGTEANVYHLLIGEIPSGDVQSRATVPTPRRSTSRFIGRGIAGTISTPVVNGPAGTTQPASAGVAPRRYPARAAWRGVAIAPVVAATVATVVVGGHVHQRAATQRPAAVTGRFAECWSGQSTPQPHIAGTTQPRAAGVAPRRYPSRAITGNGATSWDGQSTPQPHIAGTVQPRAISLVFRRTSARGIWRAGITSQPHIAGSVQPRATVAISRRYPSRAFWDSQSTPQPHIAGTRQPRAAGVAPRRYPSRAVTGSSAASWDGQSTPQPHVPGSVQPRATVPIPRRYPARAAVNGPAPWDGQSTSQPHIAGTVQRRATVAIPRRYPSRAFWDGQSTAQPHVAGSTQARAAVAIPRRYPSRAWLQHVIGPANAHGPAGQKPGGLVAQRKVPPVRAVWLGTVVRTTNNVNVIIGTGIIQPKPTVAIPRRYPSRAAVNGPSLWDGQSTPQPHIAGQVQRRATVAVPRRYPSRAGYWRAGPTSQPHVPGRAQPRSTVAVPRRYPSRALWQGNLTVQPHIPGRVPPARAAGVAPRRYPSRAVTAHGVGTYAPVVAVPGKTQPRPAGVAPRRYPGRAVWASSQALPSQLVTASAHLTDAFALTATATIGGPSSDALFDDYQAKLNKAIRLNNLWEEAMRAGGSAWASGRFYSETYQAELAADQAYLAWQLSLGH